MSDLAPARDEFARLAPSLVRATAEVGRFDVAYLTVIDWKAREEVVQHVHDANGMGVVVGHRAPCPTGLSPRTFLGATRSDNGHAPVYTHMARTAHLATFVSVPIVTLSHELYGALGGAARLRKAVPDEAVAAMEGFARLLAECLARDDLASAEQRAVRAEQAMQARGQFLAEAEHRLKSPLAVISGWASLLAKDAGLLTDVERAGGYSAIQNNSDLLLNEVQRLLEEHSAEAGSHDVDLQMVDVSALVASSVADLAVSQPRHALRSQAVPSLRATTDPLLLRQVISHLVDNAAKYSPEGTSIDVSAVESDGWVVIDVRDQGVGLPGGVDVFAAFKRGPEAAARSTDGVGLGLHIVRKLVLALGGSVAAAGNDGPGSTFTVRLPTTFAGP